MRAISHASQFKRDYRKHKRARDLDELLASVVETLASGASLPAKFRDHPLKGGYAGCRECHLMPDLLLVYVLSDTELRLIRLGSHSELFD